MDDLDRRILNLVQTDFPLSPEPFAVIAEKVGLKAEEVLARIAKMKEEGIIRRIGAVFDPRKLGYASALCAARVPVEQDALFVGTVNAYPEVTHNYRRNDPYNIWFTLISSSEAKMAETLEDIRRRTGVSDILCLRTVRTFKINAQFDV